jgi:hypothetical protein
MKNISLAFITVVALVAGCGGGDDSGGYDDVYYAPPSYGAIAVNLTTKVANIAYNYDSGSGASDSALKGCGVGCVPVLYFGSLQCGALARGSNGSFGWSSDKKEANAKSAAISQCVSNNGLNCVNILSACNSS